jgi:hypothetical protein
VKKPSDIVEQPEDGEFDDEDVYDDEAQRGFSG